MNGNWFQTKILVGLKLILNNCFYTDFFDYLINYTCFVRNYVSFFDLVVVLCSLSYKVIEFLNNL